MRMSQRRTEEELCLGGKRTRRMNWGGGLECFSFHSERKNCTGEPPPPKGKMRKEINRKQTSSSGFHFQILPHPRFQIWSGPMSPTEQQGRWKRIGGDMECEAKDKGDLPTTYSTISIFFVESPLTINLVARRSPDF